MRKVLSFTLVFLAFNGLGQPKSFLSRSELGLNVGKTYYLGDLNPYQQFKNAHNAIGALYRYNFNNRLTLRCTYLNGKVSAAETFPFK